VKVGNVVNEKDELRRYVEGLKDEIRKIVRVGMVDGRYNEFSQVKSAAEALEFHSGGRAGRQPPPERPPSGTIRSPPLRLLAVAHPFTARHRVIRFH
jgi:hypothetical protein